MLKYVDVEVTLLEIPDEITLCINISGCPNRCPGCHSKYLWEDVGSKLTNSVLDKLIKKNDGISCICFMGGDQSPKEISQFAEYIKQIKPELRIAWYSGLTKIHKDINTKYFDYIKLGPYIEEKGPLNNPNTNQVLLCKGKYLHKISASDNMWYDITNKFWKNETN